MTVLTPHLGSLFHQNIKRLPKHIDEFELYLNSVDIKFPFIGLTETWLDKDNEEFYDLHGYSCINTEVQR